MIRTLGILALTLFGMSGLAQAAGYPTETLRAGKGELRVTFIGHASLIFEYNGKVIHVDPWTKVGDYTGLPKADLVLVTHDHRDHADMAALNEIRKPSTVIIASALAAQKLGGGKILHNGDETTWNGIGIAAVPAYNLVHKRETGAPFHPKGEGNGYVLDFDGYRVYVAGDTEDIPEMSALQGVDVAFLPVNLPYTMTVDMLVRAAKMVRPKLLFPYHTGDTDMAKVTEALAGVPGVKVVIKPMS